MPFEVFKRRNIPNRGMAVTIDRKGRLVLSTAAHCALGEPRHVALLFDRDTRTIGIQPCDDQADGFLVTTARAVSAAPFVDAFDIPHAHTVRRPAVMRDGILCVETDTEGVAVSSNRAKKSG